MGAAYPVNREGVPVAGVRGYRSIEDVPDPVDLAVICVPANAVLDAAEEALRVRVRALVVITAGFAETGSEGVERQERLLELVRAHGARLIGPNCLGIAVPGRGLDATFASRSAAPGSIGFSSQSGALGLALLEAAVTRGLGLSAFVSIGNKADVSTNDLLEWWEDDESTEAILLYVESFGNPRKFGRIAQRVARRKPILALKSGTSASGQRAASSHTAALAGAEAAVDALFEQAGVIRAASLEELIDVAALLSGGARMEGRSVAILTNAGGLGILCADACDAAGLELPTLSDDTTAALRAALPAEASVSNPVDMLGSATARSYAEALPLLLGDPHVSAVIVLFVPAVSATADEVAHAVTEAAQREDGAKPVLAVVMTSEGIPAALRGARHVAPFAYPESAARALGRVADRAEWLRRPQGAVPALDGIDPARAAAVVAEALERSDDAWLDPASTRELLLAYGVPLVPERVAASADEAVARRTRARPSRRGEDGGAGRAQDRDRRHRARPRERGGGRGRRGPDRAARDRAAHALGRRRAARRHRPGSRLRPARRLRAWGRLRGADRRGGVPDRAAHRRRRGGARHARKGGTPRGRLPRRPAGRSGGARGSRPPPRAAR